MAIPPNDSGLFRTGELVLDIPRRLAWLRGEPVMFTETELDILAGLMLSSVPRTAESLGLLPGAMEQHVTAIRRKFNERLGEREGGKYLPNAQRADGYVLFKLPVTGALPYGAIWPNTPVFRTGHLAFDTVSKKAWLAGKYLPLSPNETLVLDGLIRAGGTLATPESLGTIQNSRALKELHHKFDAGLEGLRGKSKTDDYIKVVWGKGYRLEALPPEPETLFAGTRQERELSPLAPLTIIRTGSLAINTAKGEVEFNGRRLQLVPRKVRLLVLMATTLGEPVPYEQFTDHLSRSGLQVDLFELRKALDDLGVRGADYIPSYERPPRLRMLPVTRECRQSFGGQDSYDPQEQRRLASLAERWAKNTPPSGGTGAYDPQEQRRLARLARHWVEPPHAFRSGDLAFDAVTHEAWIGGKPLPLTETEARLLVELVRAGDEIHDTVLPGNTVLVSRLRSKLDTALESIGSPLKGKDYIHNVHGLGYYIMELPPTIETVLAGTREEMKFPERSAPATVIRTGGLAINRETHKIEFHGKTLALNSRQCAILEFLAERLGRPVSHTRFPDGLSIGNIRVQLSRIWKVMNPEMKDGDMAKDEEEKYFFTKGDNAILRILPITPECRASFDGLDATVEAKYDAQERGRWEQHVAVETIGAPDPKQKSPHDRGLAARHRQFINGLSHGADKFTPGR